MSFDPSVRLAVFSFVQPPGVSLYSLRYAPHPIAEARAAVSSEPFYIDLAMIQSIIDEVSDMITEVPYVVGLVKRYL